MKDHRDGIGGTGRADDAQGRPGAVETTPDTARHVVRHATPADADAVAAIERAGFPPAEAASPQAIRARIAAFPECFWLLVDAPAGVDADAGGRVVAFIDGFATGRADLTDDMYDDPAAHDPHGAWQMIFGVATAPDRRGRGCASMLMRRVIEDCRARGRRGVVLTCKERLVGFYERFGYVDEGISQSTHGGVTWHRMRLTLRQTAGD